MRKLCIAWSVFTLTTIAAAVYAADTPQPVENTVLYALDSNNPDIKQMKETLIKQAIHVYGSRKKASVIYVRSSASMYKSGDISNAVQTLNHAWVLDQDNPDVYVMYGKVLFDQDKYCGAAQMFEKTVTLQPVYPQYPNIYLVMARDYALCAMRDKTITPAKKKELLAKVNSILVKAETDKHAPLSKVYQNWAAIDYIIRDYPHAWKMLERMRAVGGEPPEKLIRMLKSKHPEPDTTDLTPPTSE